MEIAYTLDTIQEAAAQFWALAKDYRVITFNGDLGAGKTTFTRALCIYLEVQDTVSSPTYSIINEYHFRQDGRDTIMYHSDWYRLRDEDEAIEAGVEDMLAQKNAYCIVEWGERAPGLLPSKLLRVDFINTGDDNRVLKITT